MATRACPECGAQYVASVRRCIDCDVMLVDEVGADGEATVSSATPLGEGDQIAYELEGWGNQLRVTLAGMLDLNDIPHVWEVGTLVVAAPHEEKVDELIAAVEGAEPEELDEDAPQVAFDFEEITADELAELDAELIAAHIPHAWQETGELLVPEDTEGAVAAIIDAILNPDEIDEDDGLATHAALDALYVAVDKLGKDPADRKLIDRYIVAADALAGLGVPYGMSGNEWEALLAQVGDLQTLLDGPADVSDDDADADEDAEPDDDVDPDADAESAEAPEGEDAESADDDDPEAPDADDEPVDPKVLAAERIHQLRTRMLDLV